MLGGNITATIQKKVSTGKNLIGEAEESWENIGTCIGWLDYASGQNDVQTYKAKLQETSHYFLCDYSEFKKAAREQELNSENCRLLINDKKYNVLLIDDPMELHQHIEIYIQYIGGGLGV
jgi:hypothetical protein